MSTRPRSHHVRDVGENSEIVSFCPAYVILRPSLSSTLTSRNAEKRTRPNQKKLSCCKPWRRKRRVLRAAAASPISCKKWYTPQCSFPTCSKISITPRKPLSWLSSKRNTRRNSSKIKRGILGTAACTTLIPCVLPEDQLMTEHHQHQHV